MQCITDFGTRKWGVAEKISKNVEEALKSGHQQKLEVLSYSTEKAYEKLLLENPNFKGVSGEVSGEALLRE